MAIILNEREYAENIIETKDLGKSPVDSLSKVARYYLQCNGYRKSEVRRKIEELLIASNPGVILVKWSDTLDKIAKNADKYKLIEIDGIPITQAEVDAIKKLGKRQDERLAFSLLCVAKYWDRVSDDNNHWVNTNDGDLMRMANVSTTAARQNQMVHRLVSANMIQLSKRVDNLNMQVMYINDDSPVVVKIYDYRNLGNQYLMLRGDRYFMCENCGICVKRNSNSQKYCKQCATEFYIKKSVESVMKQRVNA